MGSPPDSRIGFSRGPCNPAETGRAAFTQLTKDKHYMKIKPSRFFAASLALMLSWATPAMMVITPVVLVGCSGGCASNDATYKISGTAKVSADVAMRSWGAYVKKFHPPVEQEVAVKAAFEKYQQAQIAMLNSAIEYRQAEAAGGDKSAAQAKLDAATAGISAALDGLVGLLTRFGVPL